MNWYQILGDVPLAAVSILLGMVIMFIIRRHVVEKDPFIPTIPFVRVGTPVMIGDDLYILMAYEYEEGADAQEERTVIFKSVPQRGEVRQDV